MVTVETARGADDTRSTSSSSQGVSIQPWTDFGAPSRTHAATWFPSRKSAAMSAAVRTLFKTFTGNHPARRHRASSSWPYRPPPR